MNSQYSIDFLCGSIGGSISTILCFPFDTIKSRIQILPNEYKSLQQSFTKIYHNEKIKGFYKGVSMPVTSDFFSTAVTFSEYYRVLNLLNTKYTNISYNNRIIISGAWSGIIYAIISNPFEIIKCNSQLKNKKVSVINQALDIYRNNGLKGFGKGFLPFGTREVIATSIYFFSFEKSRNFIPRYKDSSLVLLNSGGIAGVLSWLLTYPLDLIKTKIQVTEEKIGCKEACKRIIYNSNNNSVNSNNNNNNIHSNAIIKPSYMNLFSGLKVCLGRAYLINGLTFLLVEKLRIFSNVKNNNNKA